MWVTDGAVYRGACSPRALLTPTWKTPPRLTDPFAPRRLGPRPASASCREQVQLHPGPSRRRRVLARCGSWPVARRRGLWVLDRSAGPPGVAVSSGPCRRLPLPGAEACVWQMHPFWLRRADTGVQVAAAAQSWAGTPHIGGAWALKDGRVAAGDVPWSDLSDSSCQCSVYKLQCSGPRWGLESPL